MNQPLQFEDLQLGLVWRSRGRTITEADIVGFAGLTGDYDPLHVDREFARQTPFGQPVAHGLLGLALVAGLGSHFPLVDTVAFVGVRNWEFLHPVFIGDTVHAVNEVAELRENGRRRGVVVWKRQLVNQTGTVVQQGYFETLVAKSETSRTRTEKPTVAKAAVAKSSVARQGPATRRKAAGARSAGRGTPGPRRGRGSKKKSAAKGPASKSSAAKNSAA